MSISSSESDSELRVVSSAIAHFARLQETTSQCALTPQVIYGRVTLCHAVFPVLRLPALRPPASKCALLSTTGSLSYYTSELGESGKCWWKYRKSPSGCRTTIKVPRIWSTIITVTIVAVILRLVLTCVLVDIMVMSNHDSRISDKNVCHSEWYSLPYLCQCVCCVTKTLWARVVRCVFRLVLLKITLIWRILNFEGGRGIVCELGAGWRGSLLVSKIRRGKECVAIALPVCRPFRNFVRRSCILIESYVQHIFMWLKLTCASDDFHHK